MSEPTLALTRRLSCDSCRRSMVATLGIDRSLSAAPIWSSGVVEACPRRCRLFLPEPAPEATDATP